MKIITQGTIKTLYQMACEIAEKYKDGETCLKITKHRASVEMVIIDRLFNTLEFLKIGENMQEYYGTRITREGLAQIESLFGSEQAKNLVYEVCRATLEALLK